MVYIIVIDSTSNFLRHHAHTGSKARLASCPVGAWGFPRGKAAVAWSWPLTSILCRG